MVPASVYTGHVFFAKKTLTYLIPMNMTNIALLLNCLFTCGVLRWTVFLIMKKTNSCEK